MISETWLNSLRLDNRKPPEFIQPSDSLTGVPHGSLIRQSFDELGLAAIHCVSGVPSIAFLVQDVFDQEKINWVHKALWNQGFASILVVINNETLRIYSLAQIPSPHDDLSEKLVRVFHLVNDALELKDLVLGVESGRFVDSHQEKFNSSSRIDKVLLANLETTVKRLVCNNLKLRSAQALLMQIMFIAYLEDRGFITDQYFQKATANLKIRSLKSLLFDGRPSKFLKLFQFLKKHFNGDLFVAPCSFDPEEKVEELGESHIRVISEFRAGNIDLKSGQYQFWPYDFRFIPIDLISAVYDRFLGYDPIKKRISGAYYTPMFLADLVTEQAWHELTERQKNYGKYVDPSCGSGIFLVHLFEKMISQWRLSHKNQRPTWPALLSMLNRLNGFDIRKESIRVAAFSLYIALLENTKPSEILAQREKGHLLPKLCGETLHAVDFFEVSADGHKYDLVVGNPPWVSRRGTQESAEKWCREYGCRMPAKEVAWGFAWKAMEHVTKNGLVAFLLKATSFLTNHSQTFVSQRRQWMESIRIVRVINLADARFQLFEEGHAPAALMIYRPRSDEKDNYYFDYWVPKADLNLKNKRVITLSSLDQAKLPIQLVRDDQLLMKRRMWMQTPDAKLFQYLSYLPKLSEKIITFQNSRRGASAGSGKWIIGQGFNPVQDHNLSDPSYKPSRSDVVTKLPHLETRMFKSLVMPRIVSNPWSNPVVHRRGFEEGFRAPSILIPQGVESSGRVRAAYCTQDLSFRHSIQAISFNVEEEREAKFLTVFLNSSLAAWFLFHSSSNTGMERDKVHQEQLLDLPFPSPEGTRDPRRSKKAFNEGVRVIDGLLRHKDKLLQSSISEYMKDIDKIVYGYFGLSSADVVLIEDTLNYVIPSMQPSLNVRNPPGLWKDTGLADWEDYSIWFARGFEHWLEGSLRAVVRLVGVSSDLVVIGIHITGDQEKPVFSRNRSNRIDDILAKIWKSLPKSMPGNFQLIPDLRIFIDDVLYVVKPRKKRFWLGSMALADADAIASDLLAQAR